MGYIGKVPADVLIDPMVDSAAITDATIVTADIADDAITSAKLAANSVDSSELIDGSVDNSHLAGSIAVNKTLLAGGTGLTLSTNTLNVDAAQTQITSVGTLTALTGGTGDLIWDSPTFVVDSSANRVGIGVSDPDNMLEIVGGSDAPLTLKTADTRNGIFIKKPGTDTIMGSVLLLADESFRLGTESVYNMTMLQNGKVGIGTSSPDTLFHVSGTGADVISRVECLHSVSSAMIEIVSAANRDSLLAFKEASTVKASILNDASTDSLVITDGANASTLYITGNKLGIDTSPTSGCKLHIKDSDAQIKIEGTAGSNSGFINFNGTDLQISTNRDQKTGTFSNTSKSNATITLAGSNGGSNIKFYTASANNTTNTERVRIDSAGDITIKKGSYTGILKIDDDHSTSASYTTLESGGDRGIDIRSQSQTRFYVDDANTFAMVINASGRVGIGTTAPDNPLYVQNTTSISGNTQRYPLYVHNNVDDDDAWGIRVRGGNTGQTGNTEYLSCYDHDNTKVGMVHNDGGTFSLVDVSDKRLKKNIRNTDINGIDTINSIKVRDFEYKINNNTVKAQFIAQEIQEVFPQASTGTDGALTEDGEIDPMGVTKEGLVGVLVKAVQELSDKLDTANTKIEALENA